MKSAKMSAIVLAVAAAGMASMSVARADEAQARSLLKAMSDYLGAQKTIFFEYDTNLELVTKRLTENELSDFGRLWHDGCSEAIIEAQDVDRNHSPEV